MWHNVNTATCLVTQGNVFYIWSHDIRDTKAFILHVKQLVMCASMPQNYPPKNKHECTWTERNKVNSHITKPCNVTSALWGHGVMVNMCVCDCRWKMVDHYVSRVRGTMQLLQQHDIIGRTSELARLFGIQFYHVLTRGSQVPTHALPLVHFRSLWALCSLGG